MKKGKSIELNVDIIGGEDGLTKEEEMAGEDKEALSALTF